MKTWNRGKAQKKKDGNNLDDNSIKAVLLQRQDEITYNKIKIIMHCRSNVKRGT